MWAVGTQEGRGGYPLGGLAQHGVGERASSDWEEGGGREGRMFTCVRDEISKSIKDNRSQVSHCPKRGIVNKRGRLFVLGWN